MYADFLRALAEQDEALDIVADRLKWKAERNAANQIREIEKQAAQCEMLMKDLKENPDSPKYKYAALYLEEAERQEQDKDEARKDYERRRVALETEYHAYLVDRLEYEKQQSAIRDERRKKK